VTGASDINAAAPANSAALVVLVVLFFFMDLCSTIAHSMAAHCDNRVAELLHFCDKRPTPLRNILKSGGELCVSVPSLLACPSFPGEIS
jgi:hypothetical protein